MNHRSARLDDADAFLVVVDRDRLRDPSIASFVLASLHSLQRQPFEAWRSGRISLPFIVIGRLCPRLGGGRRQLRGVPICCCRDAEAAGMILLEHIVTERRDPLQAVKSTALVVLVSDPQDERAIRAMLAGKTDVFDISDLNAEGGR